jgi:hypothetical protein
MSRLANPDRIAGITVTAAGVISSAEGCTLTGHPLAGVYEITLDAPCGPTQSVGLVLPVGAVPRLTGYLHATSAGVPSDTVKTVRIATAAGVLADNDFSFSLFSMR